MWSCSYSQPFPVSKQIFRGGENGKRGKHRRNESSSFGGKRSKSEKQGGAGGGQSLSRERSNNPRILHTKTCPIKKPSLQWRPNPSTKTQRPTTSAGKLNSLSVCGKMFASFSATPITVASQPLKREERRTIDASCGVKPEMALPLASTVLPGGWFDVSPKLKTTRPRVLYGTQDQSRKHHRGREKHCRLNQTMFTMDKFAGSSARKDTTGTSCAAFFRP